MEESVSTYYQSPIGLLKISGNSSYISAITFIDNEESLQESNGQTGSTPILIQCIEELIQYFNGQRRVFEFPIHQQGTAFQEKVWDELISIPFGKTISYLDLSRNIGDPKSIRAVGSANGKNNIVIVVPCHRVIGSNHELIGYGGGL